MFPGALLAGTIPFLIISYIGSVPHITWIPYYYVLDDFFLETTCNAGFATVYILAGRILAPTHKDAAATGLSIVAVVVCILIAISMTIRKVLGDLVDLQQLFDLYGMVVLAVVSVITARYINAHDRSNDTR